MLQVSRSQFLASQLDWRKLQQNHREMWLECARDTFSSLDTDHDGVIGASQLVRILRGKLPDADIVRSPKLHHNPGPATKQAIPPPHLAPLLSCKTHNARVGACKYRRVVATLQFEFKTVVDRGRAMFVGPGSGGSHAAALCGGLRPHV